MSEPLVVIGNGMAAARFVEEMSKAALGRYAIAVIGEEPRLAYNRILLSSVLAGETDATDIDLKPARWWRDGGVTVRYGTRAHAVNLQEREVTLADGERLPFSRLVFATGSVPLQLDIPGMGLAGVFTFRDARDVATISRNGGSGTRAVVIGGGLLGLEAAYGLARGGANVTVVHLMGRLMERQLDDEAAAMLKTSVESKGIAVELGAQTAAIAGASRVEAVRLADGRFIPADMVVVAVGVRPNIALAREAGIGVERGIVVDDHMQTSIPGIHAIGECAEHRGRCFGLVEPAYEQAFALAQYLAGRPSRYAGSVPATNLKVSGVNVFSAGDFLGGSGSEVLTLRDPGLGTYKKLLIAQGCLTGAVLFGDTADGLWYLDLIRSGISVERIRDDLIFGRALAERMAA